MKDSLEIILQESQPGHRLGLELWRSGFFGKGSLSRGEPTWWTRIHSGSNMGESMASMRRYENSKSVQLQVKNVSEDLEEYELTPEETFFLSQAVDVLQVDSPSESHVSAQSLWKTFCLESIQKTDLLQEPLQSISLHHLIRHFAIRYAVYHYYRSKGWIVRCGIKFGTDFVLYQKGPIFRHSDYSVLIVPQVQGGCERDVRHTWTWALGMVRVCSQVRKTTLVCFVLIPEHLTMSDLLSPECLAFFEINHVPLNRWVPSKAL